MEKKYNMKKAVKRFFLFIGFFLLVGGTFILISPYGNKSGSPYKLIIHTVDINAPVDSVYLFLGNSANASRWSSFVDHITPLNPEKVPDGEAGSERRCFQCNQDEGMQWDELVAVNEKNKRRRLTIFNMKRFPLQAEGLATEQLYQDLGNGRSRLSFTLFFDGKSPSFIELLKTYAAAFKVKSIYSKNLENIKNILESRM